MYIVYGIKKNVRALKFDCVSVTFILCCMLFVYLCHVLCYILYVLFDLEKIKVIYLSIYLSTLDNEKNKTNYAHI